MKMNPDRSRPTRPSSAAIRFVSLGLVFFTMVALGAMAYFTERGISVSRDRVVYTYQVRSQLNDLQLQIMHAQADYLLGQRAHEVPVLPEQFGLARQSVEALRRLTADNPRQQQRLDQVARMLNTGLAMAEGQRVPRDQLTLRAKQQEIADHQKQMDALVRGMQDEEESILQQKLQDWDHLFKRNVVMLGLAFAIVAVMLAYNIRDLLAELSRRRNTEERIRENAQSYRLMSAKILELQDLERRRIARELHDSVGQHLAGLKINLSQLKPEGRVDPATLIRETIKLTDCALQEVRTISHLLHPPLLEELGFLPAARWYLDEYGKRSQVNVTLRVDDPIERLPREVEIALFRVLQECLTNVYRHAAAHAVDVRIACHAGCVTLTIADDGKGIPVEILSRFNGGSAPGIGLGGMRERLAEFGGVIHVESSTGGSVVKAIIPTGSDFRPAHRVAAAE